MQPGRPTLRCQLGALHRGVTFTFSNDQGSCHCTLCVVSTNVTTDYGVFQTLMTYQRVCSLPNKESGVAYEANSTRPRNTLTDRSSRLPFRTCILNSYKAFQPIQRSPQPRALDFDFGHAQILYRYDSKEYKVRIEVHPESGSECFSYLSSRMSANHESKHHPHRVLRSIRLPLRLC